MREYSTFFLYNRRIYGALSAPAISSKLMVSLLRGSSILPRLCGINSKWYYGSFNGYHPTWLPEPVLVGRSSSRILEVAATDVPNAVSANRLVWATFSITIPGFKSVFFRAARAFFALLLRAWNKRVIPF